MCLEHTLSILVITLTETVKFREKKNYDAESSYDLRLSRWEKFSRDPNVDKRLPIFKNKYHVEKTILKRHGLSETRGRCHYPYLDMSIAFTELSDENKFAKKASV